MRALFETRTVGEPDDEPEHEAEDRTDDTDDGAVGADDETDVAVRRAGRLEHADRAHAALREHGEAADRDERDEQHAEDQCDERDRLGVERIRLGHRCRGLDLDALERAQRSARLVEQRRDARRVLHLPGCDERELVEEALRVLDDADDPALDATDAPGGSHRKVERRRHAARHGDLVGARRVVTGDEREHRTAEGSVRVLRAELIGVDRSRDRQRLVLDHLDGAGVLQPRDDARRVRVVGREGCGVLRRTESGVLRRRVVRRDGRTHDRRRDRDGDEGEDQELLTPLAPKEAPGPADDGPAGRHAAIGGAGVGEGCENSGAHRGSFGIVRSLALRAGRGEGRIGKVGVDVVDGSPVTDEDHPVGPRGEVGVVGDHDRGDAALAGVEDHPHHDLAVGRVERTRWLVGEEELALADHGSSDGDPLALTAGELIGVVPGAIGQPELLERGESRLLCLACRDAVELEGQRDVLRRGESREEVEVLEDVADRPPTEARLVVARHRPERRTADGHLAARRLLEAAGDREQRRLSRPARAHHGDEVALIERKVDLVEGTHGGRALAVGLRDLMEFEQAHRRQTILRRMHGITVSRTRITILSILQVLLALSRRNHAAGSAPARRSITAEVRTSCSPRAGPRESAAAPSDRRHDRHGGRPPGRPTRRAGRRG